MFDFLGNSRKKHIYNAIENCFIDIWLKLENATCNSCAVNSSGNEHKNSSNLRALLITSANMYCTHSPTNNYTALIIYQIGKGRELSIQAGAFQRQRILITLCTVLGLISYVFIFIINPMTVIITGEN